MNTSPCTSGSCGLPDEGAGGSRQMVGDDCNHLFSC